MSGGGWWLVLVAAAGTYLAGNRLACGWALLAAAQLLSIPDAIAGRPGALVLVLAGSGLVSLRNWLHWRRPLVRLAGRSQRRAAVRGPW
jgi:hypothetical protein